MPLFRSFVRITTPVLAFGAGFLLFPADWRKSLWLARKLTHFNPDALRAVELSDLYKELDSRPGIKKYYNSESFPEQHHYNHVGRGMLFGPNLFEIDPVVFLDNENGTFTGFYHLGSELISTDGLIHNGITATILDEGLCTCGFSKLPSKRGVTANLNIKYLNQAPPNSTLVLKAKVIEAKGRKVTIEGDLLTFPTNGGTPMQIASSTCVLVEPRWFKYFSWLQI